LGLIGRASRGSSVPCRRAAAGVALDYRFLVVVIVGRGTNQQISTTMRPARASGRAAQ